MKQLAAPFVYGLAPLLRSHSALWSVEYTYFLKEKSPSLFLSALAGIGVLYDTNEGKVLPGLTMSAGAGYEFHPRVAFCCDVMFTTENETDMRCLSFLSGIRFLLY